jgi:hypothetical protein
VNGEFRTGDLPEAIRRGAVYEYGRDEQWQLIQWKTPHKY